MEGDRDGVRKIEMAKEIKRDRGMRWREIKKNTVPECRDPVLCFKTLIFMKTSPKCLLLFQSVLSDAGMGKFWKR
jgi:hypothetical protein